MRLLNVHTFKVHDYETGPRPPYIIASHLWVKYREMTYQECERQQVQHQLGYQKVQSFCKFVKSLPIYVWTDWL